MILINPGAGIAAANTATWTNTFDGARAEADQWLANMRGEGFGHDIEIANTDPTEREGRWTFTFRHKVTGVTVELETHGISDVQAYMREHVFAPRVYWNGSSSSNPSLDDFAAPGFQKTFRK